MRSTADRRRGTRETIDQPIGPGGCKGLRAARAISSTHPPIDRPGWLPMFTMARQLHFNCIFETGASLGAWQEGIS
jgi:hypothetical protein